MTEPNQDRALGIHPFWVVSALVVGTSSLALAAIGWALEWSWADEFWRSLLIELGAGVLLASGGYLAVFLLRREARREREVTVQAVRSEISRLVRARSPGSGSSDVRAPRLDRFEISPNTVDVSTGSGLITLTAELSDELAGLAGEGYTSSPTQVRFRSPSGGQFRDGMFQPDLNLVSGDPNSGVYVYEMTIPQYAEGGLWTVESFLLVDQVGNQRRMGPEEMTGRSLPVSFEVIS